MSDEPDDGFPWWLFWIVLALFIALCVTQSGCAKPRSSDRLPELLNGN